MKSVKTLALAFAVGGLSATGAWADGGSNAPANPPAVQSLMPLPELTGNWSTTDRYPVVQTASYSAVPSQPTPPPDSAIPAGSNSQDVYDATMPTSSCTTGCASGNCATAIAPIPASQAKWPRWAAARGRFGTATWAA